MKYFNLQEDVLKKYPNHSTYYVMGNRDWGKTTGTIFGMLEEYEKTGRRGVWVFRQVQTQQEVGKTMMDRLGLDKFFGKYKATKSGIIDKQGNVVIYFVSINGSDRAKVGGMLNVWLIVMDEFAAMRTEALEITKFSTIVGTATRLNEYTKILFLGNHVSVDNIYLNEELKDFDRKDKKLLMQSGEHVISDDVVIINKNMDAEMEEVYEKTTASKFAQRMGMNEWNKGSKFQLDDDKHVEPDHKHTGEIFMSYILKGIEFNAYIYSTKIRSRYYVVEIKDEAKRNLNPKRTYALTDVDGMNSGYLYDAKLVVMVKDFMIRGMMKFDSQQTYNLFTKVATMDVSKAMNK